MDVIAAPASVPPSLAHLKTSRPGDGWREDDEAALTQPADYDGPVN